MNDMELDAELESLFLDAFDLTAEREAILRARLEERRQKEGQEWSAFTRVMLGLKSSLQPGFTCLSWPSRLLYTPG